VYKGSLLKDREGKYKGSMVGSGGSWKQRKGASLFPGAFKT
jgi:hypothetical protein